MMTRATELTERAGTNEKEYYQRDMASREMVIYDYSSGGHKNKTINLFGVDSLYGRVDCSWSPNGLWISDNENKMVDVRTDEKLF